MTNNSDNADALEDAGLTAILNAAAAADSRMSAVERVVQELNSGYGDTLSGTQPYKRVDSASLVDSFFDADVMKIFGNVEISSSHQTPYGDNYDTHQNFRISQEDAHQLAENGPQGFRARFRDIADTLDKKYAEYAADIEAQRERLRAQGITDTVNRMSRLDGHIHAPKAARFSKRP